MGKNNIKVKKKPQRPERERATTVLVIDDVRIFEFPDANITYARTSNDALSLLGNQASWDEVWWDHDLGGTDTTRPVVRYLEERWHSENDTRWEIAQHNIVTDNPAGAAYLVQVFEYWQVPFRRVSGITPFAIDLSRTF